MTTSPQDQQGRRQAAGRPAATRPDLPFGQPYLIADPAAARRGLAELRRALARLGVRAEAAVARPPARAGAYAAAALARGARLLVAVGSDEVAHQLVNMLLDAETGRPRYEGAVLGLAGLGRQDLAATFGLPAEPEKLARHLLGAEVFDADVGRARWRGPDGGERVELFANCAELGYPAVLSARTQRLAAAGRFGRLGAALAALATTRGVPAALKLDHATVELRLAGLTLANGQFSMGGMKVAPRALPDDGKLSVIAFEGEPLTIYARSRELYYGEHIPHPTVREYHSRRAEVDSPHPVRLALDGCAVAGRLPLAVELLAKALPIKV